MIAALWRLRRSRKSRWTLAAGSEAFAIILALLAARHFATTSWPLSSGHPAPAAGRRRRLFQTGWGRTLPASTDDLRMLGCAAGPIV